MQGLHLTADLRGCLGTGTAMTEPVALRSLCLQVVAEAGLQAVGDLFHRFPPPGGVTGVVLLAESHLAVHTWPELRAVTLDVYVCNLGADNSAKAQALMASLQEAFAPAQIEQHRLPRGTTTAA
ncbi:MAG: adenosylmethionine decarboxylase [Rubrivivax sp.]|nr:adenosylmethionine decarboxylase [Rubrivivax sp.]